MAQSDWMSDEEGSLSGRAPPSVASLPAAAAAPAGRPGRVQCELCGVQASDEVPWASYVVTVKKKRGVRTEERVAHGPACLECFEINETFPNLTVAQQIDEVKTNEASKERLKLARLVKKGHLKRKWKPKYVKTKDTVRLVLRRKLKVVTAEEFETEHGIKPKEVAGLKIDMIRDIETGQSITGVLMRDPAQPKMEVELISETAVTLQDNIVDHQASLREEEAAEFFESVKKSRRLTGKGVSNRGYTTDKVSELVQAQLVKNRIAEEQKKVEKEALEKQMAERAAQAAIAAQEEPLQVSDNEGADEDADEEEEEEIYTEGAAAEGGGKGKRKSKGGKGKGKKGLAVPTRTAVGGLPGALADAVGGGSRAAGFAHAPHPKPVKDALAFFKKLQDDFKIPLVLAGQVQIHNSKMNALPLKAKVLTDNPSTREHGQEMQKFGKALAMALKLTPKGLQNSTQEYSVQMDQSLMRWGVKFRDTDEWPIFAREVATLQGTIIDAMLLKTLDSASKKGAEYEAVKKKLNAELKTMKSMSEEFVAVKPHVHEKILHRVDDYLLNGC
eukprot:TRINITY_DN12459_c1_g1_i4.p1 TRINITY_DN12459_c1_g1~~TRINITY_DN12459_c1_g1_i4.p1  ORF type:complete len:558 (-),score=176.24 TRINITY_DN12459_c1_g1_i4:621-2294(-)